MSRSRRYVFTINNFSDKEIEQLKKIEYSYMIYGDERGENNTPHLQGYIEFDNQRTFSSIKKQLPTAHIETAKGTPEQNRKYCSKQNIMFEDGTIKKQGTRTDIEEIKDIVKNGGGIRDVIEVAKSFQSVRMGELYLKYHEKKRTWKPIVYWFYGPSGCGKTKLAYEMYPDIYTPLSSKWWEGYDAHKHVLLDDFRTDYMPFTSLLRLLHEYAYTVETKGGSRQLLAETIIITCPYHPQELYRESVTEDLTQLIRRITEIREIKNI